MKRGLFFKYVTLFVGQLEAVVFLHARHALVVLDVEVETRSVLTEILDEIISLRKVLPGVVLEKKFMSVAQE